jgi:hypothetical protein
MSLENPPELLLCDGEYGGHVALGERDPEGVHHKFVDDGFAEWNGSDENKYILIVGAREKDREREGEREREGDKGIERGKWGRQRETERDRKRQRERERERAQSRGRDEERGRGGERGG